MAQISNGESGLSARNKLNEVIDKIEGNSAIGNDIDVTGTVTMDGGSTSADFTFGDNDKAIFGDASNLSIYFNGTHSLIEDTGLGDMKLRGSNLKLQDADGNDFIAMTDSGAGGTVELKNTGTTRLATTSTGIDVTGTVTADGLTVDGSATVNTSGTSIANFNYFGATKGSITTDGINLKHNATANMYFNVNSANRMQIGGTGDISFYEDTGTTPKFFWDASAESLSVGSSGTATPAANVIINDNATSGFKAKLTSSAFNADGNWLGLGMGYNNGYMKSAIISEAKDSNARANLHFALDSDLGSGNVGLADAKMTITYDGNVGIGTSSPTAVAANYTTLHLDGSSGSGIHLTKTTSGTTATDGSYLLNAGGDFYLYHYESGNIVFSSGASATERMRINSSGFVGINETSPATELDVNGTTTSNQYLLDNIAKDISDTAVDVFVYDTSKDSDGGAWRKRTQGTSWYNETLNTATRGSRKEFPAVAVIVVESNQVTIYDGDDPALPMWMVFNTANNLLVRATTVSSVTMQNGVLAVGSSNSGFSRLDFVSEQCLVKTTAGYAFPVQSISFRNTGQTIATDGTAGLVNAFVNDVAMTVLPNAPIDAATGLPVPTIAVATDGGVSVIKDDGTVEGAGTGFNVKGIAADTLGFTIVKSSSNTPYIRYAFGPTITETHSFSSYSAAAAGGYYVGVGRPWSDKNSVEYLQNDVFAVNSSEGLDQVLVGEYVADRKNKSLIARTTSTYNTGWMNGDIKLATLSDTDATNVTGSELVTNGTFDTDVSGWTPFNTSTIVYSSGQAFVTSDGSYGAASQAITTEVGKTYVISLSCTFGSSNGRIRVGSSDPNTSNLVNFNGLISGDYSFTFVATTTTTQVTLGTAVASGNCTFDNVSVRLAEEDRSVNGNGLQVFGTVTKSAVASGADLVAYSGFSASNYLMQPYNADLDFGTGDFCIVGWNKGTDTAGYLIARNDGSGSTDRIAVDVSSSKYRFYLEAGATGVLTSTSDANTNTWTQFCALRRSGATELYINGKLEASGTSAVDLDNSSCVLHIGDVPHVGNGYYGSLALFRISATAPSPEQIKKIYEDEKVLFQENAQATLYGSSDAVTALAYDDTTELLHVGTSAGRSSFQGLRRVDNTTDAITAAISASNGLVAEE